MRIPSEVWFVGTIVAVIGGILWMAAILSERGPAESSTRAGVGYQVDRLFEVDGCQMYRFEDGGYTRYFAACDNSATVSTRISSGKTSRPTDITTGYR